MNKKYNIPKKILTKEYKINQKSSAQVAKIFGCTKDIILDRLREFNIKIRSSSEAVKLLKRSGKEGYNFKFGETLRQHYCIDWIV